jgi:CRP-like cAMP-binding protein
MSDARTEQGEGAPAPAPAPAAAAEGTAAGEDLEELTLADLLGAAPLFAGVARRQLERLASIGEEEQHKKNEKVFSEGDPGDRFYLILEGQVRISREVAGMGEEALAILGPGECFGEMALVDGGPRSADAIVHERCRLFVLRKDDLEDLLFVDRELSYDLLWNFVRTLSARLRETNNKMTMLSVSAKFG